MLIELKGLTKYFGGLAAVNQFDMVVNQEEIVGLIGPNGAGYIQKQYECSRWFMT